MNLSKRARLHLPVATLGALVFSLAAIPASASERFPISIADVEARVLERFNSTDTDASGAVDLDEFMAAEPGREHRGGKRQGHRKGGKISAEQRAEVEANVFALLDSDGDGNVSEAEFQDADRRAIHKQARKQAMFSHLDTDGNGLLTTDEMPDPADRLRQADSDGDGQVTRAEMRAARQDGSLPGRWGRHAEAQEG